MGQKASRAYSGPAGPRLTAKRILDSDSKGQRFIWAEYESDAGQASRKKVYFHTADNDADYKKIGFQHLPSDPEPYYTRNFWEKSEEIDLTFPAEENLPSGVAFGELTNMQITMLPHVIVSKKPDVIKQLNMDKEVEWLKKYLKVKVQQQLACGPMGVYHYCKVMHQEISKDLDADDDEFADDKKRLIHIPEGEHGYPLVIKEYIACEMDKPEQMNRIYEETLAHVELNGHENIIKTYAVRFRLAKAKDADNSRQVNGLNPRTDLRMLLLTEYSAYGSWSIFMKKAKQKKVNWEVERAYYYWHLENSVRGLYYLHSTLRAHRAWSYDNILVTSSHDDRLGRGWWHRSGYGNVIMKLCDFSFTKQFDQRTEKELMRNWQSMDVMDLARMILWFIHNEFTEDRDEDLRDNLKNLVEFLMKDTVEERLGNFKKLVMRDDNEFDAEGFFKRAIDSDK